METVREKRTLRCPLRWFLLFLSLGWIGFYFAFRSRKAWMNALCGALVRPWHRFISAVCDVLPFSAAEWLIAAAILAAPGTVGVLLHRLFRRSGDGRKPGRLLLTAACIVSVLFGLFCLWWGVYYYADSFCDQSGLSPAPVSVDELEATTRYFAALCNEYAGKTPRCPDGSYAGDKKALLALTPEVYTAVEKEYPCLKGKPRHAKSVFFSPVLSYLNTTGFFFAFTGEANLNTDMPACLLPATAAHELAHQRGVAAEDEANFVAVLSCLCYGQEDYVYSAAVMAYIYLGNALYRADYDRWKTVYESLSEEVHADMRLHNLYWDRFETPVKEVSDKVYTGFLKTYGDDRGLRSYGACVDLLVAYYGETAMERCSFVENSP